MGGWFRSYRVQGIRFRVHGVRRRGLAHLALEEEDGRVVLEDVIHAVLDVPKVHIQHRLHLSGRVAEFNKSVIRTQFSVKSTCLFLHFEPCLDALSLRSDVISSTKVLELFAEIPPTDLVVRRATGVPRS